MRREVVAAVAIAIAVGCGGASGAGPVVPAERASAAAAVASDVRATATIELPERAPGGANDLEEISPEIASMLRDTRSDEEVAESGELLFHAPEVRDAAGDAIGRSIDGADVETTRDGRRVRLVVRADGEHGALARCSALVRAHAGAFGEGGRAASEWLGAQRARVLAQIAELDASLHEVPTDPYAPGFDAASSVQDPVAMREAAIAARDFLARETTTDDVLRTSDVWALRRLAELRAEAILARVQLSNELGPQHPDMLALAERIAAIDEALATQRALEIAFLDAQARELEGADRRARRDPLLADRARARALILHLDTPEATIERGVSSSAPLPLRLLADDYLAARLERLRLGQRYGDRHPRMIALGARMRAATADFDAERARALERLLLWLTTLDTTSRIRSPIERVRDYDLRVETQRRQREQLLALLALLERRAGAPSTAAPMLVEPCRVTTARPRP